MPVAIERERILTKAKWQTRGIPYSPNERLCFLLENFAAAVRRRDVARRPARDGFWGLLVEMSNNAYTLSPSRISRLNQSESDWIRFVHLSSHTHS